MDDELDRRQMMQKSIDHSGANIEATFAETGSEFIELWKAHKDTYNLLSLDHDLRLDDPMDGLDVVNALLAVCESIKMPVIIHSSNGARSLIMQGEFELEGWTTERVAPFGIGWVDKNWLPTVLRLLNENKDNC